MSQLRKQSEVHNKQRQLQHGHRMLAILYLLVGYILFRAFYELLTFPMTTSLYSDRYWLFVGYIWEDVLLPRTRQLCFSLAVWAVFVFVGRLTGLALLAGTDLKRFGLFLLFVLLDLCLGAFFLATFYLVV